MVCEKLDVQGTGFNNAQNCISIYSASPGSYAYDGSQDYSNLAGEARKSDSGFIDLMDDASRANLAGNVQLSANDAHDYNWGVITWVPVVKVTSEIPMSDGSRWYTHDGVSARVVQNNFASYVTTSTTPFSTAPAEEAVVLSNNGGTWFRFQSPFRLSADDIASHASFTLDLTLDPDGLVTAGPSPGSGTLVEANDGGDIKQIRLPALDLTPVAHLDTAKAVRETYNADVSPGDFKLRVELYSIDGDPQRTVYGVGARVIYKNRTGDVSDFSKISFLEMKPNGLEFQVWDKSPAISDMARGEKVGDTVTATVHCQQWGRGGGGSAAVIFTGCPASGVVPVTFTLQSIATL